MTDLSLLIVSLTKHGAHKIADLIKAFPSDQVLENTWDKYRNIKIDRSQTIKILSANPDGTLPKIWENIRQMGDTEIENLVLIAIIFSHNQLIKAMASSNTTFMRGIVRRGEVITGKSYTNFAGVLDELGFATEHTPNYVTYDLRRLFYNDYFPALVKNLIAIKLISAGWNETRNFIDECLFLGFHEVFSISEMIFELWMGGDLPDPFQSITQEIEDQRDQDFQFRAGHAPRKGGAVRVKPRSSTKIAHMLHNKIQNKLYSYLVMVYGDGSVGTENESRHGKIDIVIDDDGEITFYEIKTDNTIRMCIRHALSQLIEYSYWPDDRRADKLIIVSQNPTTDSATKYMQQLRNELKIPVYYQQFNIQKNELSELI